MILINETGAYMWDGYTREFYFDFHSDRDSMRITAFLVLRYAIFIVEITHIKFIVLAYYHLLDFLVEF